MKKTLIALALVAGLATMLISCDDHSNSKYKDYEYVPVTDTNGVTVTDTNGEVVTERVPKEESTTNDASNADTSNENGGNNGGLDQGGANTEGGWGQIITP